MVPSTEPLIDDVLAPFRAAGSLEVLDIAPTRGGLATGTVAAEAVIGAEALPVFRAAGSPPELATAPVGALAVEGLAVEAGAPEPARLLVIGADALPPFLEAGSGPLLATAPTDGREAVNASSPGAAGGGAAAAATAAGGDALDMICWTFC